MTATDSRPAVDAITAAVIGGSLRSIADEMGYRLARMSYSSIIRESEDFGCALCDHEGRQLCEATQSTPLQSGPIGGYLAGITRRFAEVGDAWREGDVVVHNHPYYGASHQPDVGFCVPVFVDGALVGLLRHHRAPPRPRRAHPRLVRDRRRRRRLRRRPAAERGQGRGGRAAQRERVADHRRQLAHPPPRRRRHERPGRGGQARRRALRRADRAHGLATVRAAAEHQMDHSERMLRNEIAKLPDGRYEAEGFLDGFLDHPDARYRDLRIKVAVTVSGSDLHVDLDGTAEQVDLPINMPLIGTTDIAIYVMLRSLLLDTARHDAVATNAGLFRPVTISAPLGTLANPRFPAPTIARFCPGNIVADVLMRAMAPILPEGVAAGVGNLKVVAFSGERDGGAWVYMDIMEGSYGGRHGKDGLDAVDTLYANTRNNPIEDIESHYPLRVRRYELVDGGAGRGRWRGGLGSVRDFEFLADGGFSLEGDGNSVPPPGLFGGERARRDR